MSSSTVVYLLTFVLLMTSLFMILLVLIQRGRGGGLAGAFGGMGGQSAFGTRAGDVFTKITIVVAVLFILVAALLGIAMRKHQIALESGEGSGFSNPNLVTEEDETTGIPSMTADDASETDGDSAAEATEAAAAETEGGESVDAAPTVADSEDADGASAESSANGSDAGPAEPADSESDSQ